MTLIDYILSWIFIHQVRYPQEACLFAFRLMPYLLGLFGWGACRVSKLGVMSKRKSCKIDRIVWEMHAMSSFGLYARVSTAHSLRRNPPKLRRTEWAVGTHACIHSQKENAKLDKACISHTIRSILQLFLFDIAPNLLTLHAPQ